MMRYISLALLLLLLNIKSLNTIEEYGFMGTSDKWGKELYFAICWEGSLTPPTELMVPYLCSFLITMPPIPPLSHHTAPYVIKCVCVGGGGGHMHVRSLWTFEPFIQPLHLGPSELGKSSRKPIGSGWTKVKSALGEKLSICMHEEHGSLGRF